jgi:hypothetical protein
MKIFEAKLELPLGSVSTWPDSVTSNRNSWSGLRPTLRQLDQARSAPRVLAERRRAGRTEMKKGEKSQIWGTDRGSLVRLHSKKRRNGA